MLDKRTAQSEHTKGVYMPAVGGRQPFVISYRDYGGETKTVRVFTGEITAVSLPGLLTALGTLKTAMDAVTLGVRAREHWGEETIVSNARASTKDAQVETELLVRCVGATTQKPWSFRIPTVDYTKFEYADPPAGDQVIISGDGASDETDALIAAIEALCKMPDDDSEAVTVVGMEVVR
jgi:hypothetical protein